MRAAMTSRARSTVESQSAASGEDRESAGGKLVVCLALTAARGPSTMPARAASRVLGLRKIKVHPDEK
jgi:hypothetical protein